MNEHEEPLETVDILYNQGLILTSSGDGSIKIWNACKDLVREIKFNEDIKEAVFLNDQGDIVIAHGGQVSIVYASDYQPYEIPLPSWDEMKGNCFHLLIFV